VPVVQPPQPRYRIEDVEDGLTITISSQRHWFGTPVLGIYLIVLWLMIGLMASIFFEPSSVEASDDLTGWVMLASLVLPLVGYALYLTYVFLANKFGEEIILIRSQSIVVRRRLLMFGRLYEYHVDQVHNLRIQVPIALYAYPAWITSVFGFVSKGSIAFDYGARTFRFGSGADEAEAKQILSLIWERFPQYRNTQHALRNRETPS
jgi:hypothetical protein